MGTEPLRVEQVEQAMGYVFRDRTHLEAAASVDHRGFGSLEHLGDAVADLAVGITSWRTGRSAAESATLVANRALDAVFARRFDGLVNARSGDVVESLIGAVHVDAGFDQAAHLAVTWCASPASWTALGDHRPRRVLEGDPDAFPVWLGALTLEALVTDRMVRRHHYTETTQHDLTQAVRENVRPQRLRELGARLGLWPLGQRPSAQAVDRVRSALAATLVATGWDHTAELVEPHLVVLPLH